MARAKFWISVERGKSFFHKQLLSYAITICPSQIRHTERHMRKAGKKVKNSRTRYGCQINRNILKRKCGILVYIKSQCWCAHSVGALHRQKCSEEEVLNLQTTLQDVHRNFIELELILFWQQFPLPFYCTVSC